MPPLTTVTRIVAVATLGTVAVAGVATSHGDPGPAGTSATSATTTSSVTVTPSATSPTTTSPTTTSAPAPAAPALAAGNPGCEGVQHAERAAADGTGHEVFQRGRVTDAGSARLSVRSDDGTTDDYALDVNTAYGRDQAGGGPRPVVGDRVVVAGRERGGVLVAWWVAPDDGCTTG